MHRYKEAILYTIFIIILFVFSIIKIRPKIVSVFNIEKDINAKMIESVDLEKKLDTLKTSEMEKVTSTKQLKNIYKPAEAGLDTEDSFTVVFDDLIEMARYNGIKIYSIEYVYNPPEDDFVKGASDKYNVCQLNMQVIADYLDFESFLREIYKYPYLVNINKIELAPYTKNKKILLINLQLKLYVSK